MTLLCRRSAGIATVGWLALGCGGGPVPGPMPKAAGESCEKPFMLTGTALKATTQGFTDDEGIERSSCGGGGAPDLVIGFSAAQGALVTLTVTPSGSAFQPIVKVRSAARGCVDLDEACSSSTGRGKPAEITDWPVSLSGTQYVVVDGQSMTEGEFTLKVVVR